MSFRAGAVLRETDGPKIGALLGSSSDYVKAYEEGEERALFYPRCWREFASAESQSVTLAAARDQYPCTPIAFLHQRTSPGGTRRLVIVSDRARDLNQLDCCALELPSLFEKLPRVPMLGSASRAGPFAIPARLRGSTIDPHDAGTSRSTSI